MTENWTVYLARCKDQSVYVGCTSNIEERIKRHNNKEVKYTADKLPLSIEVQVSFTNKTKAYQFEKYLKSGSGRAFMYKRLLDKGD